MVWLHENREEFKNAVLFTADQNRITPAAVEKDYYVIHLSSYIVDAKNRNELNDITYMALTSPKTIEIMQDLINATLIKKANATTEEENEENKESQT